MIYKYLILHIIERKISYIYVVIVGAKGLPHDVPEVISPFVHIEPDVDQQDEESQVTNECQSDSVDLSSLQFGLAGSSEAQTSAQTSTSGVFYMFKTHVNASVRLLLVL